MIGESFEDTFTSTLRDKINAVKRKEEIFPRAASKHTDRTAATAITTVHDNYRLHELNTSVGNTRPRRGL